jgi:hypothetical protein
VGGLESKEKPLESALHSRSVARYEGRARKERPALIKSKEQAACKK